MLRDLRALGCNVQVVARSEQSHARALDGGAARVVREIEDLGDVSAIVVVTPISVHAAALDEVLTRNVPVFVEKPLCDDPSEAEKLATKGTGQLFVMDKWRYHPGVAAIARIAREGSLGGVHGLRTIRIQPENRHAEDAVWVLTPHDLAIALEVLGALPRPRAAVGQWDGDRLVVLHSILEADLAWHVSEVSERAATTERRVELHCDDGVAVLGGGWDEHVLVHRAGADVERVEAKGELPLLAELRAFVEFVSGGPPPKSTAAEGAAAVKVITELRVLAS